MHFQDFNAEVLRCLTIPNITSNSEKNPQNSATDATETRFFSGDWGEVHSILDEAAGYDVILMAETVYSISALPNLYKLIKKVLFDLFIYSFLFNH